MIIKEMFKDDIERKINGVVKVDQNTADVLKQEVQEYVITREIRKHIITFFNNYSEAFNEPTADIGVWISGFFGSGKSHFLKMLSYLLENKVIDGKYVAEYFREKFDDAATFMTIESAIKRETDTILFNIDIEGSINKDKTAVLRVFAKMFYNYLGFYGENLKVAKLEQFIDKRGKTEEFRRVFEEKNGASWLESRDAFVFFEDDVVETLTEVLGMSETAARNWFDGTETVETSIAQLVSEMKEYVDSKPENFRLLFMVDEVGQYVGDSLDLLINLQSLVEKIGSECGGKIWVFCTGQEAIDEIIKTRQDMFSRIQARFKTRLSLSSSSADEVIQKRILKKKPEVKTQLESLYDTNDSVLRNLFTFKDAILDIKGYSNAREFSKNFPFVPYQFVIMQKVFSEIRKHGNSGKHLSGGERSMLSGFQEAAKVIKDKDEYALAPFYLFYDTVHTFLDGSIRRVIERCQRAADDGSGIEQDDVKVLKLLYLIRYIREDIPANIDNIVILMADDISIDKIIMRTKISSSLDRLLSQNYIGRTGNTYNFLTDEEQDIQREISNTQIDTSKITARIAQLIFNDIYAVKKFKYGKYDFPFDQMVDSTKVGFLSNGMCLQFLTVATEAERKNELTLMNQSTQKAIVVLADTPYYESLENAMKIRSYVKQHNVPQMPKSVQEIIRKQQDEAANYETESQEQLVRAIENGEYYVDGEHIENRSGNAKTKIDRALEYLVSHVYSELDLITRNFSDDNEILSILKGTQEMFASMEDNRDAAAKIEDFLSLQDKKHLTTSMFDIQSRYQAVPYGWKEIDIAAVVAQLIFNQKITVKYAGNTIQPNNPKLPDMLRKKSEIGKTILFKRQIISAGNMKRVREFLREYFDIMDVPNDEDGLVDFIVKKFTDLKTHYEDLLMRYSTHKYPDRKKIEAAIKNIKELLYQQKDNIALVSYIIKNEDNLFDRKDDMSNIESFFDKQVTLFDSAVKFEKDLRNDLDYIRKDENANNALNQIRLITLVDDSKKFDYRRIRNLKDLMTAVRTSHDSMLEEKRRELMDVVRQCRMEIHTTADNNIKVMNYVDIADSYYTQKQQQISECECLALLDGMMPPMWQYKDTMTERIENALKPPVIAAPEPKKTTSAPPKKSVKNVHRQVIFPAKTLESEEDIDAYLEKVKAQMLNLLKGCDGIKLN